MRIKFNRFATSRSFRSPAEFARYAEAQAQRFKELEGHEGSDYQWWASTIEKHWTMSANAARGDGATQGSVQQSLTSHPAFNFDSNLVPVLLAMTAQGRQAAAQEIAHYLSGRREQQNPNIHIIHLNAHAEFSTAIALDSYAKRKSFVPFEKFVADHEMRLDAMLTADLAEIEERRTEFADMIENARARHETLDKQAKGLIQDSISQWRQTHHDYVEQLATETAVELWSKRATAHETRYKSFRKWSIGFGLIGFAATILWIFGGIALARFIFADDQTAQIASYTAGSLALFTLFVWGLRVLVRSMMSEDHLSTGASARSALAHTYLALTKEQAATPEDRAIILASLFAPVSDGLVKDDGMPTLSPTAIAAQMLTNPRS